MQILIVGGAGFVGSNFVKFLLNKYPDYKINILDKLQSGKLSNLNPYHSRTNFESYVGSINDDYILELLIEQSDLVINFADDTNPLNMNLTNCVGVQILLELIAAKRKRLIHISDYRVYGGYSIHPNIEEDILNPITIHSASKAASDQLVIGYSESYWLNTTIIRPVSLFGPNESPTGTIANIIINTITGTDIIVPNGNYEIMFVEDLCSIIDKVIHSSKKTKIYNAGSGIRCSMTELAHMVKKIFQANNDIIVQRITQQSVQYGVASDRLNFELGKYQITPLKEGLIKTSQWYYENSEWWTYLLEN